MIIPLINTPFSSINLYQKPINMRLDGAGSQELSKSIPRGGFLLPAPKTGEMFAKLERGKVNSLFRS